MVVLLVKKFSLCLAGLGLMVGCCVCVAQDAAKAPVKAAAKKPAAAAAAKPAKVAAQPAIVWRGDHVTARVVKDLAKQYETSRLGKVEVQPFSTISGLDAVGSGGADVAGSARTAKPDRAEEKGINFFPLGWDALVPITSPKNPVSSVSIKQLHDIYLGRLTNWSDLGGAPAEINLYGVAGPLDGVEYSTRQLLFHDGNQDVSVPRLYVNTDKLEEGITIDPHGFGMSTLSAVAGNPAIKILAVEGVYASTITISDGSYPFYSALYLAARDDGANKEAVLKFVQFADSDAGRAILRKHNLVPLTDAPDLMSKQDARVAFVDARLQSGTLVLGNRPVSAPNATADLLSRTAPNATETQQAKAQAARISADKAAAKKAAATPSDAGTGH